MLFVEDLKSIEQDIDQYRERNDCYPKVIAVKMTGVFALGDGEDSYRVTMHKEQIDFIKNWEVEKFRLNVSLDK